MPYGMSRTSKRPSVLACASSTSHRLGAHHDELGPVPDPALQLPLEGGGVALDPREGLGVRAVPATGAPPLAVVAEAAVPGERPHVVEREHGGPRPAQCRHRRVAEPAPVHGVGVDHVGTTRRRGPRRTRNDATSASSVRPISRVSFLSTRVPRTGGQAHDGRVVGGLDAHEQPRVHARRVGGPGEAASPRDRRRPRPFAPQWFEQEDLHPLAAAATDVRPRRRLARSRARAMAWSMS